MALRVLMFGWEFPPHNSGGLGTACYGLTKALAEHDVDITFVLPKRVDVEADFLKLKFADLDKVKFKVVASPLYPYITSDLYDKLIGPNDVAIYGRSLFEEVQLYGHKGGEIAKTVDCDVIHAHDWLAFPAGLEAQAVTGKPLVVHVHATEFDRTGGAGVNKQVYEIERHGMEAADKVVAVSGRTKQMIIEHYGINPDKIQVVYNGIEPVDNRATLNKLQALRDRGNKIILSAGRLTLQKGVDYFIRVAKKVLEYEQNVYFVVAGSGDMQGQIIRLAAELGIGDRVIFAGFVRGSELDGLYQAADLYVLPSVSEPFGITPLEAITNGTPVLISKQSGVAEVVQHALKTDFWDVDEMANQIVAVLRNESLGATLTVHSEGEVRGLTWRRAADECLSIYKNLILPAIV